MNIAPKISIITVVKNSADTIQRTINSVKKQNYKNFEYIVIDGISNDGTLDILKNNLDTINILISEKDNGPSGATNKGIKKATGEYIFWLCADDWMPKNFLSNNLKYLSETPDVVYSNLVYVNSNNKRLKKYPIKLIDNTILYTMPVLNTPTFIIKRNVFFKFGFINESLKIANDYDLALRFYINNCSFIYNSSNFTFHYEGGLSSTYSYLGFYEELVTSLKYNFSLKSYLYFFKKVFKRFVRDFLYFLLPKNLIHKLILIFSKNK